MIGGQFRFVDGGQPQIEVGGMEEYERTHVVGLRGLPLITPRLRVELTLKLCERLYRFFEEHPCSCQQRCDNCGGEGREVCPARVKHLSGAMMVSKSVLIAVCGAQLLQGEDGVVTFKTSSFPPLVESNAVCCFNDMFTAHLLEFLERFRWLTWKPESRIHTLFHQDQQLWVLETVKCWHVGETRELDGSGIWSLPLEVLFNVLRWVCRPPFVYLRRCLHCNKIDPSAKRCSGCKTVHFCGRECQAAAWPKHKEACQADVKRRRTQPRGADMVDMIMEAMVPKFVDESYVAQAELYGMKDKM